MIGTIYSLARTKELRRCHLVSVFIQLKLVIFEMEFTRKQVVVEVVFLSGEFF